MLSYSKLNGKMIVFGMENFLRTLKTQIKDERTREKTFENDDEKGKEK